MKSIIDFIPPKNNKVVGRNELGAMQSKERKFANKKKRKKC